MAISGPNPALVVGAQLPAQKKFGDTVFPLILQPQQDGFSDVDAVEAWVKANNSAIKEAALQHGAVLLRGFPVTTAEDFNTVIQAVGLEEFPYVGGAAPRTVVTGSVFTANESPADQLIPFHHELAQSKNHPGTLIFFCFKPATKGGETPICPSHLAYERIKAELPRFVAELEEKGVRYVRVMPAEDDRSSAIGRGWQSTFLTHDKAEAEKLGKELGMDLEWLPTGALKTISPVLPATKPDPRTGRLSWFNSIVAAFTGWKDSRNDPTKAVVFGDGTALNPDDVGRSLEIMNELAVSFTWEQGDMLIVDNYVALHSRNSFEGERIIYASLWK
jgi:alpha-ketoglutarate-dependent taurine dioxygenase